MRAKALILGMVLTLCVSADTPAADLGAINIQNNIETIGNNISVLNKDLNVTKLQKKTVKKKNKKKTKLSEIYKYKKKIFDMGVVDLSDNDDECAKIYKTKDKKSKVIGYLPDAYENTILGSFLDKYEAGGFTYVFGTVVLFAALGIVMCLIIRAKGKRGKKA